VSATGGVGANLTTETRRHRVNRGTISDRDWLVHLDDRVHLLLEALEQGEKRRSAENDALRTEIRQREAALRVEIFRATRSGWHLVVAGLVATGVGIVVSFLA
jgi:hypothetical protein